MGLIKEALARRMAGGGGTPATQQVSAPADGQTPLQVPPQVAPTGPLPLPQAQPAPQQGAPQPAQQAPSSQGFDGDTKTISKALIARLLKVL